VVSRRSCVKLEHDIDPVEAALFGCAVLTGVGAALVAQGKTTRDAARIGAWVCGRAAEIAIRDRCASQESLCASDVLAALGPAFNDLRAGVL
jgi:Zn-dependent alcohol dehydrogenase